MALSCSWKGGLVRVGMLERCKSLALLAKPHSFHGECSTRNDVRGSRAQRTRGERPVRQVCPFSVRHIIGGVENMESQIQDALRLAVCTISLVVLGFVKKWKSCGDLVEAKGERDIGH
jgi:hypothetical protein